MANLFKTKAAPPVPPAATPAPVPVPDPNNQVALEAAQKKAAEQAQMAGRASTVLTRNSGPAANRGNKDTYGGSRLGSG